MRGSLFVKVIFLKNLYVARQKDRKYMMHKTLLDNALDSYYQADRHTPRHPYKLSVHRFFWNSLGVFARMVSIIAGSRDFRTSCRTSSCDTASSS